MRRLAPFLLLLAAGCVEFVAPAAESPRLMLTLQFTDSTEFTANVEGVLVIGADADGRRHTVVDPALRFGAVALEPTAITARALQYRSSLSGEAALALYDAARSGTIAAPVMANMSAPAGGVDLPVRTEPPSHAWTTNSFIFRTGLLDQAAPGSESVWRLSILMDQQMLQVNQRTAVPPQLVLSRTLLGPCTTQVQTRLDVLRSPVEASHPSGYSVAIAAYITLLTTFPCP